MFSVPSSSSTVDDDDDRLAREEDVDGQVKDVFVPYHNRSILPGCNPHPGEIVESGSLASLSLPEITYPLGDSFINGSKQSTTLSSLQLEGIVYACQRHQQILPNGTRAGFFIGDAAGVGKGRQIAGIIMDNFARGRKKHVWFSIASDLVFDARRDMTDIGCHINVIEGCKQLDKHTRVFGLSKDYKEGVVFSTYSTLVSSVTRGSSVSASTQSRLNQLISWCGGEEFDGCLIFDECHKAKNFIPNSENASSKVAIAVEHIQSVLPKARVVYCSATGVTEVKNMGFMMRLGLWGEGAPFTNFEEFLDTVHKKGLGVIEMLSMEMKLTGIYVTRCLSYKHAQFLTVVVEMSKEQRDVYNTATHLWNELRKSLTTAFTLTMMQPARIWTTFWGNHQRFFKQLCLGMKVPSIVTDTLTAIEEGFSVVIGLQSTGEASLDSDHRHNEKTKFTSICRDILIKFITQYFPTKRPSLTDLSGFEDEGWCVQAKHILLDLTNRIVLPMSPLDELIDKLGGPKHVAEMTGRRMRIVRNKPTDRPYYELRSSDVISNNSSVNLRERNLFMSGKKHIAIISDASSTGISLHADARAVNQRRRIHLTFELPWSADKAVQQLGRSHRSNQTSAPLYKLVTTELGGEMRFAAAVAKRLQMLGALTKGDRRAATGADMTEFNFDTPYGRHALKQMYQAICKRELLPNVKYQGVMMTNMTEELFHNVTQESLVEICLLELATLTTAATIKDGAQTDVGKFLNRILGLDVGRQQMMFKYFSHCLDAQISAAKKEGKYNEGLVDILASSIDIEGQEKQVCKKLADSSNNPTKQVTLVVDRGMSWEAAMERLETFNKNDIEDSKENLQPSLEINKIENDESSTDNSAATMKSEPNWSSKDSGKSNAVVGFYRSRRDIFGRKVFVLVTPKENNARQVKIARPSTGVSSFDEDIKDLNMKYVPVNIDEAEHGWKEQYDETKDHCIHGNQCKKGSECKIGSRRYYIELLCGGIVKIMTLLESTLMKYADRFDISKPARTMKVVRATLNNGERLIGMRYPAVLIPLVEKAIDEQQAVLQLKATMRASGLPDDPNLLAMAQLKKVFDPLAPPALHPTASLPSSSTNGMASGSTEPVTPVDPTCLRKAITPPNFITTFFKTSVKKIQKTDSSKLLTSPVAKKPNNLLNHFKIEPITLDSSDDELGNSTGDVTQSTAGKDEEMAISSDGPCTDVVRESDDEKAEDVLGNSAYNPSKTDETGDAEASVDDDESTVIDDSESTEIDDDDSTEIDDEESTEIEDDDSKEIDDSESIVIDDDTIEHVPVKSKESSRKKKSTLRSSSRSTRSTRSRLCKASDTASGSVKPECVDEDTVVPKSTKRTMSTSCDNTTSLSKRQRQEERDSDGLSCSDKDEANVHDQADQCDNDYKPEISNVLKQDVQKKVKKKKSVQKTLNESWLKPKICPICNKDFPAGTSNIDLNKHIDNCLIE